MLGLAEARQVGVDDGSRRAGMPQVDLDLTEVFPLLQHVGSVGMAQGMDMRLLLNAAGSESQPEAALQGGPRHGLGSGRRTDVAMTFGREQQAGVAMGFPLLAQELEGALRQRNIAITIALAAADVQEHAFGVDVADLQAQGFTQAQSAGVDGDQADTVVEDLYSGQHATHLGSRKDNGQLELMIGAGQFQLVRPLPAQGFFPEDFEGADCLGAGLTADLLVLLQVNAVLAEIFGREEVGGLIVVFAELAHASVVGLFGAGTDGQQLEVIGKGFQDGVRRCFFICIELSYC